MSAKDDIREDEDEMDAEEDFDEQQEMENDESSDSDSSESDEKDEENQAAVAALEQKIGLNQYDYDSHCELIATLEKMDDLDLLRNARERMSKAFPLTAKLWLNWLNDEIKLAQTPEERKKVEDSLFERAVKDYLSIEIWQSWMKFKIDGNEEIEVKRSFLNRALTAGGLHVKLGSILWNQYRDFENNIMISLQDANEQEEQRKRIVTLYRRQLSVPLIDMEKYRSELDNAATEEEIKEIEPLYQRALKKLQEIQLFESRLEKESPIEVYKEYIEYEKNKKEPTRVQMLYERAVEQSALDAELWFDYVNYLDRTLKIGHITQPVIERALRNIPWDSRLWIAAIRSAERNELEHIKVQGILEQALEMGFSTEPDYRSVWETYLDYLRRRIPWHEPGEEKLKRVKELRECSARAIEHLVQLFGKGGDPQGALTQTWALCEASLCNNMERARNLFNDLLSIDTLHTVANAWLQYISLERLFGDEKHLRKVFIRALNATKDWPESIGEAWLNFERVMGTLESFEDALEKVQIRMKKAVEDRAKEQETEQPNMSKFQKKKLKRKWPEDAEESYSPPKNQRKQEKESPKQKTPFRKQSFVKASTEEEKSEFKTPKLLPPPGYKPEKREPQKRIVPEDSNKDARTVFVSNLDFNTSEDEIKQFFERTGDIVEVRLVKDFKGRSKGFCYVEFATHKEVNAALKLDRELINDRPMFISKFDPDQETRKKVFKYSQDIEKNKLFVRGLPKSMNQDDVRAFFEPYGKLKDVRLVTFRNGHSKGLAYIDFVNETEAANALMKTDGQELEGFKITVAISRPPERKLETSLLAPEIPCLGSKSTFGRKQGSSLLMPRAVRLTMPSTSGTNGK